ncbi:hypothetical protein MFLAVUS_004528 [Mucor flavus]|uniref:Transcription initiation factor TFIID subunit 8 n=1 Tax=Mucor flavus TaxID=439312 RepID=A0ABP9YW98_9FUNG
MEGSNEEDQDLNELGSGELFEPFRFENYLSSDIVEGTEYNLVRLLESINERAGNFSKDCQLPKMKLSALYCLGVTIQEYSRYLATDIVTEKRATEGLEPLTSLFSPDERNEQKLDSLVEKYKPKDIPAVVVDTEDRVPKKASKKLTNVNGPYSFRTHHKFNVATSTQPSFYDKMLDSSDWRNVLKKKQRDPEAEERAAEKRREKNKLLAQKIAEERVLQQEQKKQEQSLRMLQNNQYHQPQSEQTKPAVAKRKIKEEGDIFDTSKKRKTVSSKPKKKKKSANPF